MIASVTSETACVDSSVAGATVAVVSTESTGADKSVVATACPFTVTSLVVKLASATTDAFEVSEAGVSTLTETAWLSAL